MLQGMRRAIRELRESRPGTRFQRGHERYKVDNRVGRLVLICVGLGLALGGALTFWLPGPNFLLVFAGLAIVAAQWKAVARRLDRAEIAGRRWNDEHWAPYPHKRRVIALAWVGFVVLVALLGWVAWRSGWLPGWLPWIG